MIRQCNPNELETIFEIINDAAFAYYGVIPKDCWKDPYMSMVELQHEIEDGVQFWGFEVNGELTGVMGIQLKQDVTLIRHAYVRTTHRNQGIGGQLLNYLYRQVSGPVLIGTWADASWAIKFYQKHGFALVPTTDIPKMLRRYWSASERQFEVSVVLADKRWLDLQEGVAI